jgi:hypothetical protein
VARSVIEIGGPRTLLERAILTGEVGTMKITAKVGGERDGYASKGMNTNVKFVGQQTPKMVETAMSTTRNL